MVQQNTESQRTAFLVTVDYRHGTTTGISAADRAATIQALVDPATRPDDLLRPGHIFPLEAREGGVLKRAGHTEAAVDLARMAGCAPVGVLCEIVSADRHDMARRPELEAFCAAARAAADLDRRHDPPPAAHREARAPGRHGAADDDVGRLRRRRVRVGARRRPPPGVRARRRRRRRRPARAGPQRVPDRRRVRLRLLPVRPHARRGDGADRRGGHRRARLPARPRGPRPRRGPHARRRRRRRSGDRPGDPSPTAASSASAPRSSPTSASRGCG